MAPTNLKEHLHERPKQEDRRKREDLEVPAQALRQPLRGGGTGPQRFGLEELELWRKLFRRSNPAHYYVPLSPITVIATLATLWLGRRGSAERRGYLVGAYLFSVSGALLTYLIVTRVNLKLYFDQPPEDEDEIRSVLKLGGALGAARLVSEAAALYSAVRAYETMRKG